LVDVQRFDVDAAELAFLLAGRLAVLAGGGGLFGPDPALEPEPGDGRALVRLDIAGLADLPVHARHVQAAEVDVVDVQRAVAPGRPGAEVLEGEPHPAVRPAQREVAKVQVADADFDAAVPDGADADVPRVDAAMVDRPRVPHRPADHQLVDRLDAGLAGDQGLALRIGRELHVDVGAGDVVDRTGDDFQLQLLLRQRQAQAIAVDAADLEAVDVHVRQAVVGQVLAALDPGIQAYAAADAELPDPAGSVRPHLPAGTFQRAAGEQQLVHRQRVDVEGREVDEQRVAFLARTQVEPGLADLEVGDVAGEALSRAFHRALRLFQGDAFEQALVGTGADDPDAAARQHAHRVDAAAERVRKHVAGAGELHAEPVHVERGGAVLRQSDRDGAVDLAHRGLGLLDLVRRLRLGQAQVGEHAAIGQVLKFRQVGRQLVDRFLDRRLVGVGAHPQLLAQTGQALGHQAQARHQAKALHVQLGEAGFDQVAALLHAGIGAGEGCFLAQQAVVTAAGPGDLERIDLRVGVGQRF